MKKLYLLFAFLFALIGYQDAGAWMVYCWTNQGKDNAVGVNAWIPNGSSSKQSMKKIGTSGNNQLYVYSSSSWNFTKVNFYINNVYSAEKDYVNGEAYQFWGSGTNVTNTPKIYLYRANNSDIELTLSGTTYVKKNVSLSGNNITRIKMTVGDNTFWMGSDNYYKNPSSAISLAIGEGNNSWLEFDNGDYDITFDPYAMTVSFTKGGGGDIPVISGVNMPLKRGDFDGKSHYFLVGQRMGAYRLQPEWEFQPVEGQNYLEIPDRLLYNGYVFVARVDNYDDYVKQLYTGYFPANLSGTDVFYPGGGNNGYDLTTTSAAKHNGKFTSVRYNDINNTNPAAQVPGTNWTSVANHYLNIASAEGIASNGDGREMFSSPSRAKIQLVMGLDGKTPARLDFVDVSTDAKKVAELRTFSLVGGSITNHEITHVTGKANTPLNVGSNATGGTWQEAWIQYDADEKPYIDGYGEYIYQTVFQKDWLEKHPSLFNFPNDDDEPFRYNSSGITFTYDPTRKHDSQFGQRTVGTREERVITYMNAAGANDGTRNNYSGVSENYNDKRTLNTDNMVCYTVEGMWMEKDFKIWSGWSGCMQSWEYDDSHNAGGARWLRDNAGHGAKDEKRAVYARANKDVYFSLFENVGAADFATGYDGGKSASQLDNWDGKVNIDNDKCERQYFNRVEIWFDTENNFVHNSNNASMICFRQIVGTPNIWIRNHPGEPAYIDYNYDLPLVNGQTEADDTESLGNVVWYKIERMPIVDGVEGERQLVKEENVNVARKDFHPIDNQFVKDESKLPSGRYRYAITVKREKTGDETYEGLSNRVYVPRSASANLSVEQTKDTDGRWNFDLKFTASAPESYVGVKVRDDEGNETDQDALELMEWYTINLPEGFSYTDVTLSATPETTVDGEPYKLDGNTLKIGRLNKASGYAMPDVTLENIRFGNLNERHFDFTSNVGSTQEYWIKNAQVADGTDDIDLTVPATKLDIMAVNLIPEDNDPAHLDGHGDRHNVRKGHTREDNNTDLDNGVNTALSRANRIEANGVLDVLEVSDKVLENYDVKVGINLIYPGHEFVYTTPVLTPGVAINSMDYSGTGIGVDLSYLPLETREANIADLSIGDAKDLFKIEDETFASKHGVTMERTYNAPANTTVNYATHTYYQRKEDQENVVESQVRLGSRFSMIPAADMAGDSDAAGNATQTFRLYMPAATGSFGPIGVQLHKTSWQGWYDAFAVIGITEPTSLSALESVPHYSIGIFTSNGETPATYDPSEPYHPIYPGGNVLDCSKSESNGYSSNFCVLNDRPSKRNFGEAALDDKVMKLPVLIGNVKNVGRDATLNEIEYRSAADPYGVLFTSYPIAFKHKDKDQLRPVVEIKGGKDGASLKMDVENKSTTARDASTPVALLSAEVPNVFKGTMGNATTDLDEVLGDFNTVFRAYPNPAVDIVNVEASAEIGDVEVVASNGAVALKSTINDTKGQLDVSALPAGLYLLRTQAGTTRLIVK
ncbi:MAG: T9SS type A sorting domain-containing protein [Muribaculaceae bacterium]